MQIKGCKIDYAKFVHDFTHTYVHMNLYILAQCVFLIGSRGNLMLPRPHIYKMYICICYITYRYKDKERNEYKIGKGYLTSDCAHEYGIINVSIRKLYS